MNEIEAMLQAFARTFDDELDDDAARIAFVQGWNAAVRWIREQRAKEAADESPGAYLASSPGAP